MRSVSSSSCQLIQAAIPRQTMTSSGSSRAWPNRRCTPALIELRSVVQRFMMSPRPDSVKFAMSSRSTLE